MKRRWSRRVRSAFAVAFKTEGGVLTGFVVIHAAGIDFENEKIRQFARRSTTRAGRNFPMVYPRKTPNVADGKSVERGRRDGRRSTWEQRKILEQSCKCSRLGSELRLRRPALLHHLLHVELLDGTGDAVGSGVVH